MMMMIIIIAIMRKAREIEKIFVKFLHLCLSRKCRLHYLVFLLPAYGDR